MTEFDMGRNFGIVLALLAAATYQLKHFLADFPLQNQFMLKKFERDWSFFVPLASHSFVHALLTFVICYVFTKGNDVLFCFQMALLDFVVHFIMDRIKAGPKYLGRFNDVTKKPFWLCVGIDQMVHHLTHYFIIWRTVIIV